MDVRVWSDRHWSFWRCGAGSVGVLRLECGGICGACRFVPRSWSASVYSSTTYDYLGALWEILRVNVATLLVMDDHPDCVSTCTPLQNQLCYATWVTYTWVALLLRRPFLAIESGFVHPCGRNQVVDHSKLKSRDGVFWMEVYHRLSELAHTQMEKVWSRIILVHDNFFLSYSMFACFNALVLCYYFFFSTTVSLF